jgi:adenine deaminase
MIERSVVEGCLTGYKARDSDSPTSPRVWGRGVAALGGGKRDAPLALLVIAGLTPVEALRSATLNPAKFLGLDRTLGAIEQGKIADLVLLDANPLEDIRNTQRINAVVSNGRLFDRKALDKMLAEAEDAANW